MSEARERPRWPGSAEPSERAAFSNPEARELTRRPGSKLGVAFEPTAREVIWRAVSPVARVRGGSVIVDGRRRAVMRLLRVEARGPRLLVAWAEIEGPRLGLLRARVSHERDEWSLVALQRE